MSVLDTLPSELLKSIAPEPEISSTDSTQPSTSLTLDLFPPELIDAIVSNSPEESLQSLCLVGKRFVELTQRRLFHSVVISNEVQCENLGAVFLSKPHLAHHVKSLSVTTRIEAESRGILWPVSSIKLPAVMLKLTVVVSFWVVNNLVFGMRWKDLQPSLRSAIEETMSRPTLTSVRLVNFVFPSTFELARLLGRAKASLEKIALVASPIFPLITADPLHPEPATHFPPQIEPKEVTIYNDIALSQMRVLLPAPANPCPFINTSHIYSLNLEIVNVWIVSVINNILPGLPSLRSLRIAPFNLPLTVSSSALLDFQTCTQLTSLCLDFTKGLDCLGTSDLPFNSLSGCPIKWAAESLNTFSPQNSIQSIKLGVPPETISAFLDHLPVPATLNEMEAYIHGCPLPALTALSFQLAHDFPGLRYVELFIGVPEEEARYRPVLNVVRDYLTVGWRAKGRVLAEVNARTDMQ